MIFVKGPLLGWGLENMNLEGNSLCTIGLKLQSAQFGTLHRVTIMHFKQVGLLTTCVPAVVFEDTNTQKNIFSNLDIHLPDVSGAVGIKLTSGGAGDADTYLNTFIGVLILLPQTNTTMTGLWL